MNLKTQQSFITLLAFAFLLLAGTVATGSSRKLECKQTFLNNFGIEGVKNSIPANLPICPSLDDSCCKRSDGISIYSNWEMKDEKKGLASKLASFKDVYVNLLIETQKIAEFAETLVNQLKDRNLSNCKILAQRVLHFQIKQVAPKLTEVMQNLEDFFEESYKGFYCSICDARTQSFILVEEKQLVFSKKYCRNMTASSLHFLLYFYVHFAKYVNLLVRFTTHCNYRGEFTEKEIPPHYIFQIGPIRQQLELCKQGKNEEHWFEVCRFICEKFKLTEFNEFFAPNVLRYQEITGVLSELRIQAMTTPHEVKVVNAQNIPGRLLMDVKKEMLGEEDVVEKFEIDPLELEHIKQINLQDSVIKSSEGLIPIQEFRAIFEDYGIDLLEYGKQAKFSRTDYEDLVEEADLAMGVKRPVPEEEANGEDISVTAGGKNGRMIKSTSTVKVTFGVIALGSLLLGL